MILLRYSLLILDNGSELRTSAQVFLEEWLQLATPEDFPYEDDTFHSVAENGRRRERMIRLVFVLRRKQNLTRAEFQQYWRDIHGPLVAKHSTTLNILRYVQLHTLDDPVNNQPQRGQREYLTGPDDQRLFHSSRLS